MQGKTPVHAEHAVKGGRGNHKEKGTKWIHCTGPCGFGISSRHMGYSSSAGHHLVVEEGAGDSVTHIHLLGDALVERSHTLEIGVLAVLAWVDRSHWSIRRQAQLGDQALHNQTFASSPAIDLRPTQGASQALELIADQLRLATSGVA